MSKRKLTKASAKGKPGKRSNLLFWGIAGAVALVAVAAVGYLALRAGQVTVAKVGSPAPDFTLRLLDGQSVSLSSLKGKPVLLNFWASG